MPVVDAGSEGNLAKLPIMIGDEVIDPAIRAIPMKKRGNDRPAFDRFKVLAHLHGLIAPRHDVAERHIDRYLRIMLVILQEPNIGWAC